MPKAVAHPTDSRLLERRREHLVKAAAECSITLRQNYNREALHLAIQVGRYAHARQFKRMNKALRTLRSRVGRVWRDIARTPYEFGVKVSITTTLKEGFVLGARSMPGNRSDGHTLPEALEQAAILADAPIQTAIVDKGYRGIEVPGIRILRSGQRRGVTKGLKAMIKRRSAIEPTIGHMKSDGKLGRNWLKGALGDALHAILCGAGHNIRLRLRHFYALILALLFGIGHQKPCIVP